MNTSCYIGQLFSDGSVRAVRCHYDGYPTGVGQILLNHWGLSNIRGLIENGNISRLESDLESTQFLNQNQNLKWDSIMDFAKNGQEYNYLLLTTDRWYTHNRREYPNWIDLQLAISEYHDDE